MSSANDLVPSYSFEVTLDSITFSFSKVTNISGSVEIEPILEGGNNSAPIIVPKPKRNPDILVLERGVTTSLKGKAFALIKEGCKIGEIQINVLRNGKTVRIFYVYNAVIIQREFSGLDATESGMLFETLNIAHTGLTEMPVIF